jgi:hypothetical protein
MDSRKPKRPHEVHIKAAENSGYIVRHSYDNRDAGESWQRDKEYVVGSHNALMKHVKEHLGPDSGAYAGMPDVHDSADVVADRGTSTPAGIKHVPGKGTAPTRRTHGAGMD